MFPHWVYVSLGTSKLLKQTTNKVNTFKVNLVEPEKIIVETKLLQQYKNL
jgi:hypothetical protein